MSSFAVVADCEPVVAGQPRRTSSSRSPTCAGPAARPTRFPCGRYELPCRDGVYPQPQLGLVVGIVRVQLARPARRGPRRDRTAGIAFTKGFNAWESCTLTPETATDKGIPARSDKTCIFENQDHHPGSGQRLQRGRTPRRTSGHPMRGQVAPVAELVPGRGEDSGCPSSMSHGIINRQR